MKKNYLFLILGIFLIIGSINVFGITYWSDTMENYNSTYNNWTIGSYSSSIYQSGNQGLLTSANPYPATPTQIFDNVNRNDYNTSLDVCVNHLPINANVAVGHTNIGKTPYSTGDGTALSLLTTSNYFQVGFGGANFNTSILATIGNNSCTRWQVEVLSNNTARWYYYNRTTSTYRLIMGSTMGISNSAKSNAFIFAGTSGTVPTSVTIDNIAHCVGSCPDPSASSVSNFTVTNKNNYNNASISNFVAIINGTNYNTTTGTIITPYLSNSTDIVNITIISNNMFNKTYTNYNISSDLLATQDQYPIIYLTNTWNNTNITTSNIIINSINYNTTSTYIYIPLNATYDVSTNVNDYFNITESKALLQNTISNISVYQSVINLTLREFDSNISLKNFTVNITGYPTLINVSGFNTTIYPNTGTYNITRITDNTGQEIYQLATTNFTINTLDNKTIDLYVYEHVINVTAKDIRTNATINNFTITITDLTDGTDTRILNTTNGTLIIPVIHHNYTLTIDGKNFALYNNTANYSVSSNINKTFYLYTTNSFDIKFYDEITKALLNTKNITLEAISDAYANNYSTSNGTLYIDLLTPDKYLLRYKSLPDYAERTYTIVLSNRTYNQLNLYLVNGSQTITINVKDQDDNNLEEAYIKVLRYDLTTNGYTIREIITTDISGNAYFQGILNTEFYKFIVEYPLGDEKLSTSADYLRSTTLTLRINTQEDTLNNYFTSIQTYATMTFNNETNTFTYYYNDATNTLNQGCLYIYRTINTQTTLINSSCNSGSSGTITLGIVNSSGYYYNAQGTVLIDNKEYLVASKDYYFNKFTEKKSKNNFLFLTILLTLAISLLFLWNVTIALILTPIPLVFMSFANLIPVSRGVTITIALIGLTLAFMISKRS